MTVKTISINDVTIDVEKLRGYNKSAQEALRNEQKAKDEFAEICETVERETGIKKTDAAGFFKARFNDKTDKAIAKGTLFETLNGALDN